MLILVTLLHVPSDLPLVQIAVLSMNLSDLALSVPDEADGEDAKEGCMAELLLQVFHQLWTGLWQCEVQKKNVV